MHFRAFSSQGDYWCFVLQKRGAIQSLPLLGKDEAVGEFSLFGQDVYNQSSSGESLSLYLEVSRSIFCFSSLSIDSPIHKSSYLLKASIRSVAICSCSIKQYNLLQSIRSHIASSCLTINPPLPQKAKAHRAVLRMNRSMSTVGFGDVVAAAMG